MSDPAAQRIRSFSRVAWIVGAVAVAVIGIVTFPPLYRLPDGRIVPDGGAAAVEMDYPWLQDSPIELSASDGTIAGDAHGGWLSMPADAEPVVITLSGAPDDEYVGVYQGVTGEYDDRYYWPTRLNALFDVGDAVYAVPATADDRIWFASRNRDWRATVAPADAEQLDGTASGSGPAVLEYHGEALSARFTHSGGGILHVTIVSAGATEVAVNDVDEVRTRASWKTAGTVLFVIDSSGGEWTVTVDE
ncbi:MAG: hypothetical protein WA971_10600 [Microbacterium sp.]